MMKTTHGWLVLALAGLLLLTSGCGARRVVWSPDGTRAAVLGEQGLYFSDPDGKLSGVLVSNVAMAEWFSDSHRLALVRGAKAQSWADLQAHLRPEDRDQIVQQGQTVLRELNAGNDWKAALNAFDHADAIAIYLKGVDGVKEKAGVDWTDLNQKEVSIYELHVGTISGDQVTLGPALVQTLQQPLPEGLRVSPAGNAIAMTTDAGKRHGARLMVVAADGSAPGKIVSEEACAHPDWTKDGRSLLYINAFCATTSDDDTRLGALTRRQVINAAGAVEIQTDHDDLAGLLFDVNLGVRSLSDGRILFVALDVQFPITAQDMPQQPQIFALDPQRQPTLTRLMPRRTVENLPPDLGFFEISPDEKKVLMAAGKGAVLILTLADGNLTTVQAAGGDEAPAFPCWRGSDEVCYFPASPSNSAAHTWEVALWKEGTNRVISAGWPAELRAGFLDK
jgi:hypothetical protein